MCTALKRRRVGSWDIVGQSHKLTPPPPPPVVLPLQARYSPKKTSRCCNICERYLKITLFGQIRYYSTPLHHQSSNKTAAFLQQVFTEISYYCIAQVRLPPTQGPCLASYEAAVHLLTLPYWQRSPESPCSPPKDTINCPEKAMKISHLNQTK